MITVNKIEFFRTPSIAKGSGNYVVDKPCLKMETTKGEIIFPLDTQNDDNFYIEKMKELADLATTSKLTMSYDFREERHGQ